MDGGNLSSVLLVLFSNDLRSVIGKLLPIIYLRSLSNWIPAYYTHVGMEVHLSAICSGPILSNFAHFIRKVKLITA